MSLHLIFYVCAENLSLGPVWLVFVSLAQSRVTCQEGTSVEGLPSSECPFGMSIGHS